MFQIFDHIIKHHHEKLRLKGYHDFYRATSMHKGIPLYIVRLNIRRLHFIYYFFSKVSLWNTSIMAIQTLIQHYYGSSFGFHCVQVLLSPIVYITLFSCAETIILTAVHGSYISEHFFHWLKILKIWHFVAN